MGDGDFTDFGWFLVTIGVIWFAIIVPYDFSCLRSPYILPLLFILGGISTILFAYVKFLRPLNRFVSIAFIVLVILFVRANWVDFGGFISGSTQAGGDLLYDTNFTVTNETVFSLSCGSCRTTVMNSEIDDIRVVFNYSDPSVPTMVQDDNRISVTLNRTPASWINSFDIAELYLNDIISHVSISTGAGSMTLDNNRETVEDSELRISTGAGSVNISEFDSLGFENIYLSTGAGSVDCVVSSITGEKRVDIDTGVGSIDISILSSIPHKIVYNTGVGSFDYPNTDCSLSCDGEVKSNDYDNATDSLYININTGVGSIDIDLI